MTGLSRAMMLAAALVPAGSARAEMLDSAVLSTLERFREDYGFPGVTGTLALADGTIVSKATGMADREAAKPMTPETRMLAASIGNSFVGATVLSLDADGILNRTDPVSEHLGDRAWFDRPPNHATMTVADLLHHSSGLPDHVHLQAFQADWAARLDRGLPAPTPEEENAFVLDREPLLASGSGWSYSDTGYILLGLVIESVSGQSYYELAAERLLTPLGLAATAHPDGPRIPGLAVGYTAEGNTLVLAARTMDDAGRLVWGPAMEWSGGGLVSTSRDLVAWGRALLGGTAMPAPCLNGLLDGVTVAWTTPCVLYGAGVAIYSDTPREPVYGHGGWIPGYVSSLRHYADHGMTVAFQINTDVGIFEDSAGLVPALEAALADLAIGHLTEAGR